MFGFGWAGLLVSNALLSLLIIAAMWRVTFGAPLALPGKAGLTFGSFVSAWWFENDDRRWWLAFFRLPRDPRLMWYALGWMAPPIVIVMGMVVALHNAHRYSDRRTLVTMVSAIYAVGVMAAVFGLRLFFLAEYRRYKRITDAAHHASRASDTR